MWLSKERLKNILGLGYTLNSLISDRAGRKSSAAQEFFIEEAENGRPFVLLRNKKDEEINENWLSDYIVNKYKDYKFFTERINSNIVAVKFTTPDDMTFLLCYGLYVSLQQKYKSSYYEGFEKVQYILWEECIPNIPLLQNIRHIRLRCMTEIINVLSIGSTIARGRKIQYIWLGNDIKENILNPVTIGFNLLERLEINNPITDKAVFNDTEYDFYFEYFDFPGAVNHWLFNESLHIARRIEPDANIIKYNTVIKSEFREYYIYNCGKYIHISDIDYIESKTLDGQIRTAADFFRKFNAEHLYNEYELRTALTLLCTFYGVSSRIIKQYFGDTWVNGEIEFRAPEVENDITVIELEKIVTQNLSDIVKAPEYDEIYKLNELKKNTVITYSNIKIQMLMEELYQILLFV